MEIQRIVINGMSVAIPDYYQKVDSMPEDPKDSVPYMTHTERVLCFVLLFPIEGAMIMPCDKEKVIDGVHQTLEENQELIEVETGSDYVYSIVKSLKEPTGVIYALNFQKFYPESVLKVQAFFEENDTTGMRDSIVYELCRRENLVGTEDDPFAGWVKDPYDENFKKGAFDEMIPESPLSMCRELIRCLKHNKDHEKDNTEVKNNESFAKNTCDKYDYIIAACCGGIAGIIDVIFVRNPSSSKIGDAVDKSADGFVKKAAQFFWKNDKRTEGKSKKLPESLNQCVGYLERAFPVNYDARYASDLNVSEGVLAGMGPKNHHLYSLAHSPDIIGLVFSIIDQYSADGSASFIDQGHMIHVVPKKTSGAVPYLQGSDHKSKLFCGFINWIGHMLSDMVGSSSTRQQGKEGRGMGLPMPFYNMFLHCDFGDFNGNTLAETMIQV